MHKSCCVAAAAMMTFLGYTVLSANEQRHERQAWTAEFVIEKDELSSVGRNPYFILEPGYFLVLEKGPEQLTITVRAETKKIGDIETRVVEEKETASGKLVEISKNYFAISKRTNSVFYFGEDVELYKNEKLAGHSGAWLSGVNGAKFGLMMPGIILLGSKYYQEIAPGVAMDRAEIVSINETVVTSAARFTNCLKIEETTPLELGVKEYKYYSAGIGLIQDGDLKLVRHGRAE